MSGTNTSNPVRAICNLRETNSNTSHSSQLSHVERYATAQPSLFDLPAVPIAPACIPEPERKRLSGQNLTILEALRRGPMRNTDLALIALKYTSRLSDIRKAGYEVRIKERNTATGVVVYELVEAA